MYAVIAFLITIAPFYAAIPGTAKTGEVGRNHRCPFGSRKKYKNCCLK